VSAENPFQTMRRFLYVPSKAWKAAVHSLTCWGWLGFRRHPYLVLLVSAGIGTGTAILLGRLAGENKVFRVLSDVNPIWFAVCIGAECVAYAGYVLALHETARVDEGPQLGLGHAARVVVAGFGAFFAASPAGGFEVDYWALRRAGAPRGDALARVMGLGTLEYAVLAPAALGASLTLLVGAGKNPYPSLTLPWLLVVPGFAFAGWATSPKRRRRLASTDGKGRLRTWFGHTVSGLVVLRRLVLNPFPHGGLAFSGAALYWFGEIACLWASLRAFHVDVAIPALILAYATGYVVTRRALPAGGVGVAEVTLTLALYWLGVPFVPALLGVFSYRIFNLWLPIVPAFAVSGTVRRMREGLLQADRELSAKSSRAPAA
jgi:uncharacterized membrane protein YbhN (UPF0104 family)